jgi:hypothetical protein
MRSLLTHVCFEHKRSGNMALVHKRFQVKPSLEGQ